MLPKIKPRSSCGVYDRSRRSSRKPGIVVGCNRCYLIALVGMCVAHPFRPTAVSLEFFAQGAEYTGSEIAGRVCYDGDVSAHRVPPRSALSCKPSRQPEAGRGGPVCSKTFIGAQNSPVERKGHHPPSIVVMANGQQCLGITDARVHVEYNWQSDATMSSPMPYASKC